MSDPINWYQSQRSTADLWFASVDPTLPAPWSSVLDDFGRLAFYWNPETNVSQYEHPNPHPPPPPPPPPDHYQFPFEYKPNFPSSALTYRPPDYPASYMPELPVAPSYTSPIFLPHPAPPSVMYSDSIDVPQIPHFYATNPNFHDPQIYSPSLYEQHSWVFDSENRLQFNDPHQVSPYDLDLGYESTVHTTPATSTTTQTSFTMPSFAVLPTTSPTLSTATTPVATTRSTYLPPDVTTAGTGADPSGLCASSGKIKRRTCYKCASGTEANNSGLSATSGTITKRMNYECGEDVIESQLEGLDSTLGLNPFRVVESTPSIPSPTAAPPLLSFPSSVFPTQLVEPPAIAVVLGRSTPKNLIQPSRHFPQLPNQLPLPSSPSPPLTSKFTLEPLTIPLHPSMVTQPHFRSIHLTTAPPPNVTVSMLGSPSLTFAYTIMPSHWPSLLSNSTNSNDGLPYLNGCNDLDKGVPGMGFSLTHSEANLQLMHLRMFYFLYTTKTGPEVFNSWNDCSENWRVLFCWLPFDAFFNDSSGWVRKFLVGKLGKVILNAADLFEEMSKQWSEGTMGTFFGFICTRKDHLEGNFGVLDVDLRASFIHLCTPMRQFRPGWDLGDWLAKTRMVKLCFQSQENHFDDHPQFSIPPLHPINLAMHSTFLPQVILDTGVTRTIIRLLEKSANLKWLTDGNFRQEEDTFAGVSLCSMDIFLRLIGEAPKWEFTGRGSMIGSTIWHNNLTLMANGIFSHFMSGLTKVISIFTLSRHMIDTITSVCLLVSDCNTCAIQFILGNTLIVSRPIYFLESLFTNTTGNQLLHGRKMKHTPPWSDDFFVVLCEAFLIAACWVFRHANLGSSFVICCHLQSIKTSVRPSLMGNSYLFAIGQAGATWGVIFDTMLAEEDAAIPLAAIRRQFFGYMLICSSICTCLRTMMGNDVVVHKFYFDLMLLLLEYRVGLNGPCFWEQFLLCIHLTSADITYGIFTQSYYGFLMFTKHVNWRTDEILQYWNDYTHAVIVCVAFALFSRYKLENIFGSKILLFVTTYITCMSYWFNTNVSFADNPVWNRNVFISLIVLLGVILGNIVPIELLLPHLLYISSLCYPMFVEADKLRGALRVRDPILFQDDIYYTNSGISITFLSAFSPFQALDASNFIVLKIPMALAVVSNESHSFSCQAFSGFGPLNSLLFTLLNESQHLEHNVTVEKWGTNQISLFTHYISKLLWIMVATRHFLIWHHGVSFSVVQFHQWPTIFSTYSRSSDSLGLLFDKKWKYYMLAGIVVYLETYTTLVLVASIMIIFGALMAHSWENKQRQTSTCQLAGLLGVGVTWKEAEHIRFTLATTTFTA